MNILVSGVAGDIGFGVGKILKDLKFVDKIFGIDLHHSHPGIKIFDECDIAPVADDQNYIDWVTSYIEKHNIDIFIPTSEAEIEILCIKKLEKISKAKLLISNYFMVEKCLNKNSCLNFLNSKEIITPIHGIVGRDTPNSYPVIVKPCSGRGSKGMNKIENPEEYKAFTSLREAY